MKKKIKDLSYQEFHKICGSHCCARCPLCDYKGNCKIKYKKYLDSEVEVDE